MATLKNIIKKNEAKSTGECHIWIQLTHNRKQEWLKTDIFVLPDNFADGKVLAGKHKDSNAADKNFRLSEKVLKYEKLLMSNDQKIPYMTGKEVKSLLQGTIETQTTDFYAYTQKRIDQHVAAGRNGTAHPLDNTLKRVKEFHPFPTLNFNQINGQFLQDLSSYYLNRGKAINSVGLYMRYIRSMFNDAMNEYNTDFANPIIRNYPFRKFQIEVEASQNRNLSVDVIRQIRDFKPRTKREEITIDLFMFQFYLLGINVKDLFYLKHENVIDDRIQYKRFKTGRFYNIKIEPEAKLILDKYKGEKYLFWFADNCKVERIEDAKSHSRKSMFQYADHVALIKMFNPNLFNIQEELKLTIPRNLTTYFARHSFATIMREIGISKDDISLCLGHIDPERNLKTSGIYIKEDFIRADQANRKLIDFVNNKPVEKPKTKRKSPAKKQGI
jgi:integrase